MARLPDASLATLLLTSRLVDSRVAPLKASEFWALTERVDLGGLLGATVDALAPDLGAELAARVVALTERASALAFAVEELEQHGIATIAANDDRYPPRWRSRLGSAAPPHVHVGGPPELLLGPAIGIVGCRDAGPDTLVVARAAAEHVVANDRVVVSGSALGSGAAPVVAALAAGGRALSVLADPLLAIARDVGVRRAVIDQRLGLTTPYAPSAPRSPVAAAGRHKLVYALADVTFVVASDRDSGGAWAGAAQALAQAFGPVAVWRGAGEGPGNADLVDLGAREVDDLAQLLDAGASET